MIPLPLSYGERIARLPGVVATTPINMVDGLYGGQDDLLFALASDPATFLKVYTDWHVPEDQRAAYTREKTAALAGRRTALKYGWKLGDRIHLRSPGYHVDLELILRGIYTAEDESLLGFHWDYLNEALGRPDKPGGFWVRARTEEDVPRLMQTIDNQFRNGEMETRTQPMGQWVLDMLAMIGNVKLIVLSISAAMVFAVLLVVANTMGMSIRERTAELAILRVLGFQPKQLLALLAAEALTVSVAGALVGCLMAGICLRSHRGISSWGSHAHLHPGGCGHGGSRPECGHCYRPVQHPGSRLPRFPHEHRRCAPVCGVRTGFRCQVPGFRCQVPGFRC